MYTRFKRLLKVDILLYYTKEKIKAIDKALN